MAACCLKSAGTVIVPAEFKICDNSQVESLRKLVRTLLDQVLPDNDGLLYVGFNEALSNAIVHSSAPQRPITIRLKVIANRVLIIRIKTPGRGFPGNQLLELIRTMENPFEIVLDRESNRGLILIENLFNKVYYSRNGTEIMMIKFLNERNK